MGSMYLSYSSRLDPLLQARLHPLQQPLLCQLPPTPTVPEFNSAALVSVAVGMVVVTLSAVALKVKKSKKNRSQRKTARN